MEAIWARPIKEGLQDEKYIWIMNIQHLMMSNIRHFVTLQRIQPLIGYTLGVFKSERQWSEDSTECAVPFLLALPSCAHCSTSLVGPVKQLFVKLKKLNAFNNIVKQNNVSTTHVL